MSDWERDLEEQAIGQILQLTEFILDNSSAPDHDHYSDSERYGYALRRHKAFLELISAISAVL